MLGSIRTKVLGIIRMLSQDRERCRKLGLRIVTCRLPKPDSSATIEATIQSFSEHGGNLARNDDEIQLFRRMQAKSQGQAAGGLLLSLFGPLIVMENELIAGACRWS